MFFKPKRPPEVRLPVWRYAIGIGCLVVGILGLILPILPGWPFIFYGLECVGLGFLIPVRIKTLMGKTQKKMMFWRK